MIAFLTLIYVAVLAGLVWMKVLPNKAITWLSTLVWMFLLFVVRFQRPLQASLTPAGVRRRSLQECPSPRAY